MDIGVTSLRQRRRLFRALGWLVAAGLVTVAALAPASASAATSWAAITGYAPGTAENDHAATWGDDCVKVQVDDNDDDDAVYVLTQSYRLVVARAADDEDEEGSSTPGHANANTLFENPSVGETVWADSNGSGNFDYQEDNPDRTGDDEIDHVILCGPAQTTTTSSETTTTSTKSTTTTQTTTTTSSQTSTGSQSQTSTSTTSSSSTGQVHGVVGTPAVTPPATDIGAAPSGSSDAGFRAILLGLASLLAALLIIEPRKRPTRS
jgi:hypothetical protein